jgi:hypothetical protein
MATEIAKQLKQERLQEQAKRKERETADLKPLGEKPAPPPSRYGNLVKEEK